LSAPDAPFEAPWQAELFALTTALNEAGHFTWTEWAAEFGPRVQDKDADVYWEVWSEALIAILTAKSIADPETIDALTHQWQAAARATPHGHPIELSAAQ